MKSTKIEQTNTTKIVKPFQPDIIVTHKGAKYKFQDELELPVQTADELIKLKLVEEVK